MKSSLRVDLATERERNAALEREREMHEMV
jgi:hypothetical protein